MKITYRYTVLILMAFVFSCGPKKGIITKKKKDKTKTETAVVKETKSSENENEAVEIETVKTPSSAEDYINQYAVIAKAEMLRSKIPASITLAQGILESASGRGRLAVEANNHFGIKCHGWSGAKIYHDDDLKQECFRKYKQVNLSYHDHSEFLRGRKRYSNLFKLKIDDYKGWAKGLRAAGYASDRKYPEKLIGLIERYKLYQYDEAVLKGEPERVRVNSGVLKYIILRGDTLYSISKRHNTTVEAIKNLNNLDSNDLTIGEELLIPN